MIKAAAMAVMVVRLAVGGGPVVGAAWWYLVVATVWCLCSLAGWCLLVAKKCAGLPPPARAS